MWRKERERFYHGKRQRPLRNFCLSLLLFVCICGAFFSGFERFSDTTRRRQKESLENALWRGVTQYYALEGHYPETLNDLTESKDISFLGLREDNNWILDAGQIDLFRLRNRIATEIWQDMSTKPYYADKEPKAQSAVNGKVVEVILNHQYAGIYSLTEAMDRKQMKLKKYDSKNQEFHGMLWKASEWGNALFWGTEGEYDNYSETWNAFEVKYPDIEDAFVTSCL